MLILARRPGESVILTLPPPGDDLDKLAGTTIRIVLHESTRTLCRFGIDAPRTVHIVREELLPSPKETT